MSAEGKNLIARRISTVHDNQLRFQSMCFMMFKAAVLMMIDVRSWAKSHQIELNLTI
ncbi:hypothetical protein ACB092_05G156800 [Castanea dentata]